MSSEAAEGTQKAASRPMVWPEMLGVFPPWHRDRWEGGLRQPLRSRSRPGAGFAGELASMAAHLCSEEAGMTADRISEVEQRIARLEKQVDELEKIITQSEDVEAVGLGRGSEQAISILATYVSEPR